MFIRKKDYVEKIQMYEKRVDDYIRKMAVYEAEVYCAREGIERALIYLKRAKDDENVATVIERLRRCYIVSGGDRERIDEILNRD